MDTTPLLIACTVAASALLILCVCALIIDYSYINGQDIKRMLICQHRPTGWDLCGTTGCDIYYLPYGGENFFPGI